MIKLRVASAILLITAALPASAATITVSQIAADFNTPVGGSNITYQNLDGRPGNEVFHWGTPANVDNNSFTFASTATPVNVTTGTQFSLGTFSYNNQSTYGAALTSLNLTLATTVGGMTSDFLFQLGVTETPNVQPCPFPSTTPCSDRVTVSVLNNSAVFMSGGDPYTLYIDGFKDSDGNFTTNFLGNEGTTTVATVIGRFAAPVPEMASWALMVAGFGLLGAALRRHRSLVMFA